MSVLVYEGLRAPVHAISHSVGPGDPAAGKRLHLHATPLRTGSRHPFHAGCSTWQCFVVYFGALTSDRLSSCRLSVFSPSMPHMTANSAALGPPPLHSSTPTRPHLPCTCAGSTRTRLRCGTASRRSSCCRPSSAAASAAPSSRPSTTCAPAHLSHFLSLLRHMHAMPRLCGCAVQLVPRCTTVCCYWIAGGWCRDRFAGVAALTAPRTMP